MITIYLTRHGPALTPDDMLKREVRRIIDSQAVSLPPAWEIPPSSGGSPAPAVVAR